MKNNPEKLYLKIYKELLNASKEAICNKNLEALRKGLLFFVNKLREILQTGKIDYKLLSYFVLLDPKYLFPCEHKTEPIDNFGAIVEIKTEGLLIQFLKTLDLMHNRNLIYELYNALSELHASLSKKDDVETIKKLNDNALLILSKLEEILNNKSLIERIKKLPII